MDQPIQGPREQGMERPGCVGCLLWFVSLVTTAVVLMLLGGGAMTVWDPLWEFHPLAAIAVVVAVCAVGFAARAVALRILFQPRE